MLERGAFGLDRVIFVFHVFILLLFIFISTMYLVQVSICALTLTSSHLLVHADTSLIGGGQQFVYADFPPIVRLFLFKVSSLVAAAGVRGVLLLHAILIPLLRALFHQFVEVLLSMRASLCARPRTDVPVHLVPILAIDFKGLQEFLMLFVSPPALVCVILRQRSSLAWLVFKARWFKSVLTFLIIDIHIIFN